MLRSVDNSETAELMAIVNALHASAKAGLVLRGDQVLVQTDCTGAIGKLRQRTTPDCDGRKKDVLRAYHDLVRQLGCTVEFRHVKGHTSRVTHTDPRFTANRMCDLRAKRFLEQARREHRAQENVFG